MLRLSHVERFIRCKKCLQIRYLGSEPVDYHSKYNLPPWPTAKNPTPYDFFPMNEEQKNLSNLEFNKALKKIYQGYVKLYHPDTSKNLRMIDSSNKELPGTKKRERFETIMKAYEILKDPRKRVAYNRYQHSSWENYSPQASSFDAYRMANAHRKQYSYQNDEQFWRAANWEDYYRMRYNRSPPTAEEWEKNKMKILGGVLSVAFLAFVLQLMLALRRSSEMERQLHLRTLESMHDLEEASNNYGLGKTQLQRIKRFLLQRRSSMPESEEDLENLRSEERQMLIKYAKQQVDKF